MAVCGGILHLSCGPVSGNEALGVSLVAKLRRWTLPRHVSGQEDPRKKERIRCVGENYALRTPSRLAPAMNARVVRLLKKTS